MSPLEQAGSSSAGNIHHPELQNDFEKIAKKEKIIDNSQPVRTSNRVKFWNKKEIFLSYFEFAQLVDKRWKRELLTTFNFRAFLDEFRIGNKLKLLWRKKEARTSDTFENPNFPQRNLNRIKLKFSERNRLRRKKFQMFIFFSVQEKALIRSIRNRTRRKTCFVCKKPILGSNISSDLSSARGFTRQLTRYLLDIESVRSHRSPVNDCITCLRRFVACSIDCHQLPGCVLVDVPNYMEPDNLCEDAKIIKALCGGGQPTSSSCVVTLRAAYEKLKELFEGE